MRWSGKSSASWSDGVFIRSAGPRDLITVQALLRETWHAAYDGIYGRARVNQITAEQHAIPALEARLRRPCAEFIVADDGQAIAGMAFGAEGREPRLAVLHQLYVHPSFQRRGIGASLLQEMADSFPNVRALRVEVEQGNEPALRFFRKNGFRDTEQPPPGDHAALGVPALVLEKALS